MYGTILTLQMIFLIIARKMVKEKTLFQKGETLLLLRRYEEALLKTLPAKAREVLSGPSTLPAFLVSGASVALVSVRARLLG
jgi:hypothetical protein